ncbi:uncharacterized protein E5676_scaffold1159G00090 [Cucumis melo var. makuwa]|nr:uncharacterized protein LOC103485749 [Cucumis melo]KAA0032399.1 uncharacterized protein E6C27_scaffold219G002770 [Cucumis melo var. makuwa]TYJ96351.1 uncharacterized protein E5676_scaffold1159G00090 [Cucumis melo var. makuwa]
MDGLIPMFYRAMKKNRRRRQYTVLSTKAESESEGEAASLSFNIADFYVDPPSIKSEGRGYRRYNSYGGSTPQEWRRSGVAAGKSRSHGQPPEQQLVRFRSQRILSCLTGH